MRFWPDESRPAPIDGVTNIQIQKIVSTLLLQFVALGSVEASAVTRWITQGIIPIPVISEQLHKLQAHNDAFYQLIYSVPDFAHLFLIGASSMQCITMISAILHGNEDDAFKKNKVEYRDENQYKRQVQLHEYRILALEIGEILTQLATITALAWMYFSNEFNQFTGVIHGVPQQEDLIWYARGVIVLVAYLLIQRVVLFGSAACRYNTSEESDN